jgi:hypothetical protein
VVGFSRIQDAATERARSIKIWISRQYLNNQSIITTKLRKNINIMQFKQQLGILYF